MRTKSFSGMVCSVAGALEAVGDRWGFLLMRDLTLGLARYDEFQTSSDIPAQTLVDRLRHLEKSGLIVRRRYQKHPPRDEYALTPRGRDFWVVLTALREWGDRWGAHGAKGPPLEIIDRVSGNALKLALVDEKNGGAVSTDRVQVRPGRGADAQMKSRLATAALRKFRPVNAIK
jgi:DNA-binding HxlR family transcriptional regulator